VLEVRTDQLKGKTKKDVRIISNDPERPELRLQVKFAVKTLLQISPKNRIFINIKRGDAWSQEFKVASTAGKPFKITGVKSSSKYLQADFKTDKKEPGGMMTYIVKVTALPDIPIGRFIGAVEIKTDLLDGYMETIRIFGKIEGPIRYFPERIGFNPNPRVAEGQVSRTIHLHTIEGNEFEIRTVETNNEDILWKIIPVEKGRSYVLVLIWKGKGNRRQLNDKLVVSTNNNDMPIITIPYMVFPSGRK